MTDQRQIHDDKVRRRAMVWMLRNTGASYSEIARAMGISSSRVREISLNYQRTIDRRARATALWPETWATRLRAAGAIR